MSLLVELEERARQADEEQKLQRAMFPMLETDQDYPVYPETVPASCTFWQVVLLVGSAVLVAVGLVAFVEIFI